MASTSSAGTKNHWLLKAEPDSRIVKGKDVKFSVDDFENVKTSPWEGVRNFQARNNMKAMKVGEKALFYHSNCKTPGIAAFAEVSKEAYPDYTSWDPSHPYFDPKSNSEDPKWFMVDLTFSSRAKHFIPLALFRFIADSPASATLETLDYIGEEGVKSIKNLDLVTRGRLSVQRVNEDAWNTIVLLADKGGWDEMELRPKKQGASSTKRKTKTKVDEDIDDTYDQPSGSKATPKKPAKSRKAKTENVPVEEEDDDARDAGSEDIEKQITKKASVKRKRDVADIDGPVDTSLRRSTRTKK